MCKNISTKPPERSSSADEIKKLEEEKTQQVNVIEERLSRLLRHFNPLSKEFNDVLGISRALRGNHPLGYPVEGYIQILEKPAKSLKGDLV